MAPEIVNGKMYCQAVDWYAFGILLYELIYGRTPFSQTDDICQIFKKISVGKILFPRVFDKDAKSLIKKLKNVDLTKRYGHIKNSKDLIKGHRFFKGLDWDELIL